MTNLPPGYRRNSPTNVEMGEPLIGQLHKVLGAIDASYTHTHLMQQVRCSSDSASKIEDTISNLEVLGDQNLFLREKSVKRERIHSVLGLVVSQIRGQFRWNLVRALQSSLASDRAR